MLLEVTNRERIEAGFNPGVRFAIISIKTPGSNDAVIPERDYCTGILRLAFHDLDNTVPMLNLFNEQHAAEIWSFVDSLKNTRVLLIHCDAGISRSPAVAAAICKARGWDDSKWFKRYAPNMHVYRTMLNVRFK